MPAYTLSIPSLGLVCEGYPADEPFEVNVPIHPRYPMAFPESVIPEFIREDVAEAVLDAVALKEVRPNYEADPYDFLGWSDPVYLAPLELRF